MMTTLSSAQMVQILAAANATVADEYADHDLVCSQGAVPADLNGVLYRNGPGRLERGGVPYGHAFDGDGHILRLACAGGRVRYTNRFVRTREFVAEAAADRLLYRGFGTNLPGGVFANALRLKFKNAANTNVIWHGGKLLALWEGGLPHRLDPRTLATLGPDDYDGRLRNPFSRVERALSPELPFSAHPRRDETTGALFNFGVLPGLGKNRLLLYRVAADGTMAAPGVHELPHCSFIHDFALTPRYLVFLVPHAAFDFPRVLLGRITPAGSLRVVAGQPLAVLLIPRAGGPARSLDAGTGFVFHIAQGYDRDDGTLELDLIRYRAFPRLDSPELMFAPDGPVLAPKFERLTIDPASGTCRTRPLGTRIAEFPRVAPGGSGPRRYLFSVGAPPERRAPYLTCIQRLDTQTGDDLVHEFYPDLPGEPIPIPRGSDEAAWVLTLVYRAAARRTDLVILRGADLSLQAVLPLPHGTPPGFHGEWVDGACGGGGP